MGAGYLTDAPAGGPLFNAMFPQARSQASREFSNLGDFARAVYERNPRLFQNATGMSEGVGADGGFYVPTHFFAGMMDDSLTQEAVRPRATIVPMQSSSTVIPMFNLANRSTGIATLEGKLTAEGATGTTQKAALREVTLSAKKISVLVPTTTELLQDAPQVFATMLKDAMTEALAQTLDTWFIGGMASAVRWHPERAGAGVGGEGFRPGERHADPRPTSPAWSRGSPPAAGRGRFGW
ncbi:MAG: phage major capsid protein [Betaproteobacteria bacterium]|nr:phage major capsid protein [Betaproteobacteria bacterium]